MNCDGSELAPGARAARRDGSARPSRADWRVPVTTVVVLAILACGQALARSVVVARVAIGPASAYVPLPAAGVHAAPTYAQIVEAALPLCLLALATTVPLAALRPLPAAVCAAAASIVTLTWFQLATVAG